MSRRYDDDRYEERDRYYDRRERDYDARPRRVYEEELEVERERVERRPARAASVVSERRAPRQPDFLREDYNSRPTAGPLVVREAEKIKDYEREAGKTNISVVGSRRGGAPPPDRVVKDEIIIKDRIRDDRSEGGRRSTVSRAPPYPKDDILPDPPRVEYREVMRERPGREIEDEEIIIRRSGGGGGGGRGSSPPSRRGYSPPGSRRGYSPPPRRKDFVEEEDIYFRRSDSRPPPIRREVDREEILIRDERVAPPPVEVDRRELIIRERDSPPRRSRGVELEEIDIVERERSRPEPRMRSIGPPIAREREEFVFRRRPSPSPPRSEREQIIIRRREISPPPAPMPPPREPSPESISTPEREPSPEPIPYRRPPIVQHIYTHHHHIDHGIERARSPTPPPPRPPTPPPALPPPPVKAKEESLEIEIRRRGTREGGDKYFERDIIVDRERGAVDRVRDDLQVARKRSMSSRPSHRDDIRRDSGPRLRRDMWTEVTKDLVVKEAIERQGYDYEETDKFFYVIEYLKYEDVLRLVEISEDIKQMRQKRAVDRKWEKEKSDRDSIAGGRSHYDERERIYEHEHVYDSRDKRWDGRYR
ncbi:hypothetical protein KVT40_006853 [Elsinoe batatas]|uniref:DUF8035 domain-containing protein n=1 Tax=Elsinoe batatas TaxID=2601811 RepID=A0A8K0KXD7_9PEZI|nr:hypothetical protein KVT40_006853 [Elsinoe batatas]